MEDIDISIRLSQKTKMKRIGSGMQTSDRRYSRSNIIKNAIKNNNLITSWKQGEHPAALLKRYYSDQES